MDTTASNDAFRMTTYQVAPTWYLQFQAIPLFVRDFLFERFLSKFLQFNEASTEFTGFGLYEIS